MKIIIDNPRKTLNWEDIDFFDYNDVLRVLYVATKKGQVIPVKFESIELGRLMSTMLYSFDIDKESRKNTPVFPIISKTKDKTKVMEFYNKLNLKEVF